MEIAGTSLSAAQTLLTALQCPQLKDIPEIIGYKSQLEELEHTVEAVTAVLHDAEREENDLLDEQTKNLIEKLKDAVFEADDLLDEFATLAEQRQILKDEGHLSENFNRYFSSSNPLSVAWRMFKGVKKIRKKLNGIIYNKQFNSEHDPKHNKQFNFEHDPKPIRNRSRETCSYVNEDDIIGRQADLDHIVGKLLHDSNNDDVSFISIVGIGGLGKTALAQMVFNDQRVTSSFSLKKWTCVADQDQKQLDVKDIITKILGGNKDSSTMEQLQEQLRQQLASNKYLLVLDDVWTEDRHQWCELVKYLTGCQRGSWVVVTTRSRKTADIIHGETYELSGLSEDNSWRLFESTAFASDQPNDRDDLVNIGRRIVDGCVGVPLAIRVAGSLVYGQEKSKWVSVQNNGFAHIRDDENAIMPILKLSYHHLPSPLKSCFSYCALFPKDYRIDKEMLIQLWMAQGYVVPLDNRQSIGDAAEEYFSILLKRCFFQDISTTNDGEIYSCKMHDLMHDIAQSVSKQEIYALNRSNSANLDSSIKVRHLSVAGRIKYKKYPLSNTHVRSHVLVDVDSLGSLGTRGSNFPVEVLVEKLKWLRALDLSNLDIERLTGSIGELLHLRYLDLSGNRKLELLPKSITKLCNLQTLILNCCEKLKRLPKDLNRLVKLRVLGIYFCDSLTYMPRGMGKLTSLERLKGDYILGGEENKYKCSSWKEWFYGLQDLKTLNNLKGKLSIKIRWPQIAKNKEECWCLDLGEESNSTCLRSMEHLNDLKVSVAVEDDRNGVNGTIMRLIMEELQPPSNLKRLWVFGNKGVKMPDCLINATYLPLLVCLHLSNLELEYLPLFSPSLQSIELARMPRLRAVGVDESSSSSNPELQQQLQLLPCLSELSIYDCPELTCLRIKAPQLREMTIGKLGKLNLMTLESSIQFLIIEKDNKMVELPDCVQYCSTLHQLQIRFCENLQSIPKWMPKLTSLNKLEFICCSKKMERRCQKDPPGEDWSYIQHIPNIHFRGSIDE